MSSHKSNTSVAVVTGAARGIGAALVDAFLQRDLGVVAVDCDQEALNDLEAQHETMKDRLRPVMADVASEEDWRRVADVASTLGHVDVLVNNAAISPKRDGVKIPGDEMPTEEWERVLAVNLTGSFFGIREFAPGMKERSRGRIVNVASQAARGGTRVAGIHYGATKTALLGLTRSFAYELAAHHVAVNAIAPGRIVTPMAEAVSPEVNEWMRTQIPVGRLGTPEEVAESVIFLTLDNSGFITGATLDINGGSFMG